MSAAGLPAHDRVSAPDLRARPGPGPVPVGAAMDKDDRSSGGLPGGGVVIVALLTAGAVLISKAPLETSRPALTEPHLESRQAVQDIDARLWQDPFGAVAKAREQIAKREGGLAREDERRGAQRFADELARQAAAGGTSGVVVLAVMISGGPYAERAESRRRTRYAVLAGLNARGFTPVDNEHLGYFLHPDGGGGPRKAQPATIPFEVFDASAEARDRPDDCNRCRVVVLWLDSAAFAEQPLARLAALIGRVAAPATADGATLPVRWRVLGPSSSDGLRAIVDEVDQGLHPTVKQTLKDFDVRFFSGAASVPDAALMRRVADAPESTVSRYLARHDVSLLRTIGSDDRLARALVNELELRGLRARPPEGRKVRCPDYDTDVGEPESPENLPSSIAIVSEWDTMYGREQRRLYRYDASTDRPGFCVTRWHYVRGLDGRLPGDPATAAASDTRAKKDDKNEAADAAGRDAYLERPEGQGQYDYLRRLATAIRDEDAELRRRYGREYGIRAIGVLGNDVYDKLLVLQALQAAMPHAIFFTTGLDARLFHPHELAWTRNLIVASSFGLRLDDAVQRGIAPFRDSYQTSAYLSTLLAMADVGHEIERRRPGDPPRWTQAQINAWFDVPRVFEIARSGVFDFSVQAAPASSLRTNTTLQVASAGPVAAGGWTPRCGRWRLELCSSLHPPASPMTPDLTPSARFLIAGMLALALWAPALALSRSGKRRLRRFVAPTSDYPARRGIRVALLVGGLGTLALLPPLLLAHVWPAIAEAITRDGKPLSLTDGISPWPTYAIRLGTLVLCVYFVLLAWSTLATNVERIAREFRLGATRRHLLESLAAEERRRSIWQHIVAMLAVRHFREHDRPAAPGSPTGMTPRATAFWKHYLVQNRLGARLFRTTLCVLLMIAFGALVASAIGDAPIAPQRGALTASMQELTTLPTALAILFLIFFVADATLLSVVFIRGLRLHHANWPERTLQAFESRTGVPARYLDDWIDLEFVARRTRSISTLIYFPFIVLSLMLVARSPFFDDWYTPPTVIVLSMISFAIVLLCALALRRTAEMSRQQALERLRDAIMRARADGDARLAGQLEPLRDRIERLRDGAFASYTKQPLLKAVLLPFLTYGGSSLLDYLALLNL